jgi:hypothetical protein
MPPSPRPQLSLQTLIAAAAAFDRHDGRTSKDTIDSTIATLCLALDRCAPWGEGLLIANAATMERLIFAPNAPHATLAAHIWARVTIDGNICSPVATGVPPAVDGGVPPPVFRTSVLYFARSHTSGVNKIIDLSDPGSSLVTGHSTLLAAARAALANLGKLRLSHRAGSVIRQFEGGHTESTADLWSAIGLEYRTVAGCNRPGDQRWNVWLDADGTIGTNLTPFQACEPIKKQQYIRLDALKGKHPMALILQKEERRELERAVFGDIWRVAPAVTDAVREALAEYNAVRSPLYPLSKIQRLGYLDENDDILCVNDLDLGGSRGDEALTSGPEPRTQSPKPVFQAGQSYQIRTETLSVKRTGRKMNLTGELDDVQWEGSELALYIKDLAGLEHLFMEERLRADNVRLSIQAEGDPSPIEYNLQQLVEHFDIPEVPDVAAKDPAAHQHNLDLLHQIEQIVNA